MLSFISRRVFQNAARQRVAQGVVQTRALGTAKRGADITDLPHTLKVAQGFFAGKPALTYVEYKYQCDAVRVFVFCGLTGLLTLDLMFRPPKSSYFSTWGIFHWPGNFLGLFWKPTGDGPFLTAKPVFKGMEPMEAYTFFFHNQA